MIEQSARARTVEANVAKARAEVAAVAGAVTAFDVPPVPHDSGGPVGRAPKSLTTTSAIVSSPTFREFLAQRIAKAQSDAATKVD